MLLYALMQMKTYLRHVDKYTDARKHVLNIETVTVKHKIKFTNSPTVKLAKDIIKIRPLTSYKKLCNTGTIIALALYAYTILVVKKMWQDFNESTQDLHRLLFAHQI